MFQILKQIDFHQLQLLPRSIQFNNIFFDNDASLERDLLPSMRLVKKTSKKDCSPPSWEDFQEEYITETPNCGPMKILIGLKIKTAEGERLYDVSINLVEENTEN
jgi:hypothetical protein